jgi:GntR family transcriptional repressor for pyruvate dehydrogenase complex
MAAADVSAVQWKPLTRTRTHELIVAEIERRLRAGQLRAGDRLPPERQMAEALGVSRGAVREALRILEAVGVIEAGTGSGPSSGSVIVNDSAAGLAMVLRLHTRVASFGRDDLLECREMIGHMAARKAAASASAEHIAGLRAIVDRMRDTRIPHTLDVLESDFHVRLLQMSDNALAVTLMSALWKADASLGVEGAHASGDRPRESCAVAADYAAIVEAIAIGDGEGAARLLADTRAAGRHAADVSTLKCAG